MLLLRGAMRKIIEAGLEFYFAFILILTLEAVCFAQTDLCKQYAVEKDYDRAIEECTKQINGEVAIKYPEYSYSNRGAAFANKKQFDKAISDYSKAIELNPQYVAAYFNRAISYANIKQYDQAVADYGKVIELSPANSAAYTGRATVYAKVRLYDKAIADYDKAIELNPNDSTAYHNRAMVHAMKKKFDQANSDYKKALELSGSQRPSSTPETSSETKQTRKIVYHVQLGLFRNEGNARALAQRFRKKGYDAFVANTPINGKGMFFRTLIGKSEERKKIEQMAARIKKKEKIPAVIFSQ